MQAGVYAPGNYQPECALPLDSDEGKAGWLLSLPLACCGVSIRPEYHSRSTNYFEIDLQEALAVTNPNEAVGFLHWPLPATDDIFLRHFIAIVSSTTGYFTKGMEEMICKKLMTKTFLFGPVLGTILSAVIVSGCTGDADSETAEILDRATVSRGTSPSEKVATLEVSMAADAKARNPGKKVVKQRRTWLWRRR